jgi:hypothetical protein
MCGLPIFGGLGGNGSTWDRQPRRAASIAATSIFFMSIIKRAFRFIVAGT